MRCESCGKFGYARTDRKCKLLDVMVDIRSEWDDVFRRVPTLCDSCCFDGERDHVRLNVLAYRRREKKKGGAT